MNPTAHDSLVELVSVQVDPLIDIDQLCKWLLVTKDWVYDNVQNGNLPVVRLSGRQLRFKVGAIQQWIDERSAQAHAASVPGPRKPELESIVLPPHLR